MKNRIALERHVNTIFFNAQNSRRDIVRLQLFQDKIFVHGNGQNSFIGIKIFQVVVEELNNGSRRVISLSDYRIAFAVF